MFWLVGSNGEEPPFLWGDANQDSNEVTSLIAEFAGSFIHTSLDQASCNNHDLFKKSCEKCLDSMELVASCQYHTHRQSCLKKKRFMKILPHEGHGKLDQQVSEELIVPLCRYNFPKNVSDDNVFLKPFPKDYDKDALKEAKIDYQSIRKYLLRLTNGSDFKEREAWKKFVTFSFEEYLFHVGMYRQDKFPEDESKHFEARERYYTALRCEVRNSGLLILKRKPEDIFTNNFNKSLINLHMANMDIQFISDPYAVAEYVTDYCTKNEGGLGSLLKSINEHAMESGEAATETIKVLRKAMDKGREVSIQETVYRLLGLPMSHFSSVVKFINCNHPNRRDGLLKSNLDDLGKNDFNMSLQLSNY